MQKFTLYNLETGEYVDMTLPQILVEINRDRSEEWAPYDVTDWKEGLAQFTEWELVEDIESDDADSLSIEDDRDERDCQRESDLMAYYRER